MSKTSAEKYKLTQSQTLSIQFAQLEQLNLDAAGVDVGSAEHWVCVLLEELKSMSAPWVFYRTYKPWQHG